MLPVGVLLLVLATFLFIFSASPSLIILALVLAVFGLPLLIVGLGDRRRGGGAQTKRS